jgi:hypothetical protein
MSQDDILFLIRNTPSLLELVPDTKAIADAISDKRTKLVKTEAGVGTILEVLGIDTGNALLDIVYNVADFRYVKPLIEQGRLRLDSPFVISFIEKFTQEGLLTEDQRDSLLSKAKEADPVSEFDIRVAIYNDDGSLRI